MSQTLYIIAAGLGTRMGSISVPKALLPTRGNKPNVLNSIEQAYPYYDKIFVIGNELVHKVWDEFESSLPVAFAEKVKVKTIKSGLGDGHAVLTALNDFTDESNSEYVSILWGDAYIPDEGIFKEITEYDCAYGNASGVIPVVFEDNPYVTIMMNNMMDVVGADFSKRGESHASGMHDQSLFKFRRKTLLDALVQMHCAYWKNGRYVTDSGELTFLYVLHYLFNSGQEATCYPTEYPVHGYNTKDEFDAIKVQTN
jgi:bifunctional N-acetylglucosamine-1-phosphate-uridyltransferase/glucosamine-1-phosphate-acetyltransferase GlmU-like protein